MLYFLIQEHTERQLSSISYIDLFCHDHAFFHSYSTKRPIDISPIMQEGKISSRSLMSLNKIHKVPINQRYRYLVTHNFWTEIWHLSPHLRIIVDSSSRAKYTIITMRITYDIFHYILCNILILDQYSINITLNIYTYVLT
jgi:hypothetical protein